MAVAWPDALRFLSPAPFCCSERPSLASLVPAIPQPRFHGLFFFFFFFFLPSRSGIAQVRSVLLTRWERFQFYFLHWGGIYIGEGKRDVGSAGGVWE